MAEGTDPTMSSPTPSTAPWNFTFFTKPDGSEITTPQDVADTVAYSALQCDGATLWGVTLDEKDEDGRGLVICYTGNGPHSEANARLIAGMAAERERARRMEEALNRMLVHYAGQDEELCMECGEKIGSSASCDSCYVLSEARAALEGERNG